VPESSELNEDSVLLEDVAFDDQKRRANVQDPRRAALTSCVALALCLDVKNTNPYAPASASIQLAATPSRTHITPNAVATLPSRHQDSIQTQGRRPDQRPDAPLCGLRFGITSRLVGALGSTTPAVSHRGPQRLLG